MVRGRVHHGRTPTKFVPALSFKFTIIDIPETSFLRLESSLKFGGRAGVHGKGTEGSSPFSSSQGSQLRIWN